MYVYFKIIEKHNIALKTDFSYVTSQHDHTRTDENNSKSVIVFEGKIRECNEKYV